MVSEDRDLSPIRPRKLGSVAKKVVPSPDLAGFAGSESAAIYVHWPFCAKKCPYCDFNSHVRTTVDDTLWREALLAEIDHIAALYPNISARSIFFGGGTPSLMPPKTTAAVIERIDHHWGASDIEITLEANPSSVEADRFKGYRSAGVNRLSVGIQSFYDDALKFLGRLHDADSATKALNVARATFDRVSFDLIYARPDHIGNEERWREELSHALSFEPSHLSLYQLTIEDNTAFKLQYERGVFALPDEDEAYALFEMTDTLTKDAGLPLYEISNHARVGEESQHNLAYWQGRPYVGIGPGAHGRLPGPAGSALATEGVKRPEDWLAHVKAHGHGYHRADTVTARTRMVEAFLMGLRLTAGVDLRDLRDRLHHDPLTVLDQNGRADLVEHGLITDHGDRLALTPAGRPLLNALLQRLLIP